MEGIFNPYQNPRQRDVTIRETSDSDVDLEEPTIHLDANKSSQSPSSTVAHDINKSEESDEDSFEKVDEIISDDQDNFLIPIVSRNSPDSPEQDDLIDTALFGSTDFRRGTDRKRTIRKKEGLDLKSTIIDVDQMKDEMQK